MLLLLAAPAVSSLLQLALSRSREFEADLGAARLTGDSSSLRGPGQGIVLEAMAGQVLARRT